MRGLIPGHAENACALLLKGSADTFVPVALMAIDELSKCGGSPDAVDALSRAVTDPAKAAAAPRAWHRAAQTLVSLATAAPVKAATALDSFSKSPTWQLRLYAARAAATLRNRAALEAFANDDDDNVREEAIDALAKAFGHDADAIYLAQFTRTGNQVLRSASLALAGSPQPDRVIPVLQSTLQKLIAGGRDNTHDAREALGQSLDSFHPNQPKTSVALANGSAAKAEPGLDVETLRRLVSARARITMRDLGTFELTLLPGEAAASVLRFVHLAQTGYFNGLTFHRIVPNFVIQGGSPGANEYIGDTTFMRDEIGKLPQVRGTLGVSTRGRDTGDAQIYVNLVDNPRLDHEFTVFAEVSRGLDVVDRILEGDVIERVEIVNQAR
jgi:cyclophilin family peptidyl-prolyl cis-trans isomerase